MDADLGGCRPATLAETAWNTSGIWFGSQTSRVPSLLSRAMAEGGSS